MAVNVKAFLEKNGDVKGEIRRFQLQPTVFQRDTYQALKNKIAEVFSLEGSEFRLYWQDQDGDFVVFSSTSELHEAITASEADGLLRIYVKQTGETDNTPSDQASGATESEESTKDGKEKVFHPGVVCDGCDASIYGPRFKCIVCPDYDLCSTCEQKGLHPEHDKFKITHPQTGRGYEAFVPPHCRRWMHRFMKKCQAGQGPCNAGASATGEGSSTEPNSGKQGEASTEDEYLKNIGENIASFLDPFGIDVTYEVHHGDQANRGRFCRRDRAGGRGHCVRGMWGPWMWGGAGGCGGAMPRQARPASGSESQKPADGTSEKLVSEEQRPDAEEVPMTEEAAMQQKMADDTRSKEVSPTGSSEEDWTMLHEGEMGSEVPRPGREGGLYPNLQVTQAVEMMKAMGFNDDGGWLTRLLETTNGDIAQALDTLKMGAEQASRLG